MKKFIAISIAALALLCSCAKETPKNEAPAAQQKISFVVANYLTKASESSFTYGSFGVYAWSDASVLPGNIFMDNETVSKSGTEWLPSQTYYWPKSATVDFVAYYPREASASYVNVERDKITYTGYDVADKQTDLMYADKAVAYGANNNPATYNAVSGVSSGVPTLFHHALAQLNIVVKLAYKHKTTTDATPVEYDWTVKVNSMSLSGLKYKGGLELTPSTYGTTPCTMPWTKPAGEVWTPTADVLADKDLTPAEKTANNWTGLSYKAIENYYVLPQALAAGDQQLKMNLTIDTKRNGAPFLSETFDANVNLFIGSTLEAWKMNKIITYTIVIAPTKGTGIDPLHPDDDIDPDDPNLKDVEITFDPAVSGWDPVNISANIVL